jgi:hypothetical protein
VQQFNEGGCTVGDIIYTSGYLGRQKNEHGPHLLPFALNDELHYAIQQMIGAFHAFREFLLKQRQFVSYYFIYKFH